MTTNEPIDIINKNRQCRMDYRIKQSELTSVVFNQVKFKNLIQKLKESEFDYKMHPLCPIPSRMGQNFVVTLKLDFQISIRFFLF